MSLPGGGSSTSIDEEMHNLIDLPREELVLRWQEAFGVAPPKGIKHGLLERACAYHLQTKRFGGLKPATGKALLAIARGNPVVQQMPIRDLRPGAVLVREWRGLTHRVQVSEAGFTWNDQTYASLSAVAKAITGTHRSGPRFFGL